MTVLVLLGLLGATAGLVTYHASRPEQRVPGERLADVTDRLAREVSERAPAARFEDVTASAGLGEFRTFAGARSSQLPEDMGSGAAWGDYDNDGDDDLFLVAAGGRLGAPPSQWAPSLLFENRGDGTFRRDASFPDTRVVGMAAAWGDYDNDGWLDLVVTGYRTLLLFHNEKGRLRAATPLEAPQGYWSGAAWGDFDNDRDLDLYVCGYVRYVEPEETGRRVSQQYGAAVPFTLNPASFEPERNLLFRNRGGGEFEEVGLEWGVSNPEGRSLGALWHDFDQDGRLDLYVANDISDNALFLNRGSSFEDASLSALVADYRGAMGLALGDWNRDGDDDLFITHWVAQENALYDSRLRDGPGTALALGFTDVSARLGLGHIALPMVGWGTEFADLDADGWLDLLVVNGSTLEDDAEPPALRAQRPFLFWNRHGEFFDEIASANESLSVPRVSRGLAVSDYDLDGDLDFVIVQRDGGAQLLRNDMEQGKWLQLVLRTRGPRAAGGPGRGEGSTVVVRAGGVELRRSVSSSSYLSQSSSVLHFGLGARESVEAIEVHWLGGSVEELAPLAVNRRWEVREGEAPPRPLDADRLGARERTVAFWELQRAAMDAMKREGDVAEAAALFRRALTIDPQHADSRYYLANCLEALGEREAALDELERLRRDRPGSHRAHRQWAVVRALSPRTKADLAAATEAARRAHEVNPEETGSLLVLGELALMQGDPGLAARQLELATRTNPNAVGGFFLRAFVAWREGELERAGRLLEQAREARGEDWKPEGSVAEGDVSVRMHREQSPLARFWEDWEGEGAPEDVFRDLDGYLRSLAGLPSA